MIDHSQTESYDGMKQLMVVELICTNSQLQCAFLAMLDQKASKADVYFGRICFITKSEYPDA